MNLHIGQQTAGVINNAGGNQWIYGQQGTAVTDQGARQAVHELRGALAGLDPQGPEVPGQSAAAQARAQVTEIDASMRTPQPDKSRVARMLERLTRLLLAAGSLTSASAAVIGPLQTLAGWLGDLGAPILRLLPG